MISMYSDNADDLYRQALKRIMHEGNLTEPRGFDCLELSPCNITLIKPENNVVGNPLRKANLGFMAAEFVWMWEGRDDVAYLDPYNSKIKQFSDDGVRFFGAYGPKIMGQLAYVLGVLKEDPWTRQAVLNIWRESPPKTKDVPCTIMFHFIRRPVDTLNMIVYMRSQDCWLGLPYDLHNFTCVQIMFANALELKVGRFDLFQGSLHAYKNDWEKINTLIDARPYFTEMYTPLEAENLFNQKRKWMHDHLESKKV